MGGGIAPIRVESIPDLRANSPCETLTSRSSFSELVRAPQVSLPTSSWEFRYVTPSLLVRRACRRRPEHFVEGPQQTKPAGEVAPLIILGTGCDLAITDDSKVANGRLGSVEGDEDFHALIVSSLSGRNIGRVADVSASPRSHAEEVHRRRIATDVIRSRRYARVPNR